LLVGAPARSGEALSAADLKGIWTGKAIVPWRSATGISGRILPGAQGPDILQLQKMLARTGAYVGTPSGTFDAATQEAIRAFQSARKLSADGIPGPSTLLFLYRANSTPQDKAARQTREPDISGAITRSSQRRKSQPRWLVPTVMLLVATISILVTYAVMGGFDSSRQKPAPPGVADIPQERPQAASQPLLAPQAPVSAAPSRLPTTHAPRLPRATSERPGKTGAIIPVPAPNQVAPVLSVEPKTAAPLPSPAQAPQAVTAEQPAAAPKPPTLRVSGIAWQKDSTSRLAVINGSSVTEGGMVEGARVEEIFPDRVRLSYNGSTFEIQMGKDNHR